MHFYVLEDFELSLEVSFSGQLQIIDQHFDPKLVGRVRLEYNGSDIVP